ncbi:transposase [Nitrospira sp. ND1]|uniref:DDE-type integrase/transposase/recombinase n=1 Tax=Nitrospira sp. ND1 TaxID=1658518 RepID=UPI0009BB1055|nr:DDE-type integrase/transposase/recombinase [Nitrospira sp. ND1]SLM42189.1 transposase [Nitrospira sp. ND1]SLM44895.1 transposase [Nitrospira sp. ND1]
MKRQLSVTSRQELMDSLRARYRSGSRVEKCRILDEFVAVTGYHRKHSIRLLTLGRVARPAVARARPRRYGNAVAEALVVLWEASDRVCGKRLKALIPTLLGALERHGHLQLDRDVRVKVLSASAATIDRLLVLPRSGSAPRRRHRSGPTTAIRRRVPLRTFADWGDPIPGFVEADLVAHSGERASGSFAQTLTLTDVASGWTECVALIVRDGSLVTEALTKLRRIMPFQLRGVDTDNGSEFLNDIVIAYCHDHAIEFTRSRPYRKNDQAWVEQKNGSVVRRLVGYRRLEGLAAVGILARLYEAARLFVNFFQPSFKLASKTRVGARVTKRYYLPATPSARLLASEAVPEEVKDKLRAVASSLDPLRLLDEIRTMQGHLAEIAAGEVPALPASRDPELETFLKSLRTAWQRGEVRPTHAVQPKSLRDWRTRVDPFEQAWPLVRHWLEAEPDRTAKELFHRLQVAQPDTFSDGQLRTLQRRVQAWRTAEARRLILANPSAHEWARDFSPTLG